MSKKNQIILPNNMTFIIIGLFTSFITVLSQNAVKEFEIYFDNPEIPGQWNFYESLFLSTILLSLVFYILLKYGKEKNPTKIDINKLSYQLMIYAVIIMSIFLFISIIKS